MESAAPPDKSPPFAGIDASSHLVLWTAAENTCPQSRSPPAPDKETNSAVETVSVAEQELTKAPEEAVVASGKQQIKTSAKEVVGPIQGQDYPAVDITDAVARERTQGAVEMSFTLESERPAAEVRTTFDGEQGKATVEQRLPPPRPLLSLITIVPSPSSPARSCASRRLLLTPVQSRAGKPAALKLCSHEGSPVARSADRTLQERL